MKQPYKHFPNSPGVYLFSAKGGKDHKSRVLYVGRAGSLKKRIASYFARNLKDQRIGEMVRVAKKISYLKTDSLLEAVILEANLIKKYWPKYNIQDRDGRSFVYVVFPKVDFSKPLIVRGKDLEKYRPANSEIIGPFQSLFAIKTVLELIRKIFPYSACRINSGTPCFHYQIGLCPGACIGKISKEDYQKNIKNLIMFLRGEKKRLTKQLKKEYPEKIEALKHLEDVSLIRDDSLNLSRDYSRFSRIEGYDISHFAGKETVGAMVVFTNCRPDKSGYRLFKIRNKEANNDLAALEEMIERRLNHPEWPYPNLILVDGGKTQVGRVKFALDKRNLQIPVVGLSKYRGAAPIAVAGEPRPDKSGRDKLVLTKIKKSLKELILASKNLFQQIRDEAHRFAISFSKKKRSIDKSR